jgi:hypothetical protein
LRVLVRQLIAPSREYIPVVVLLDFDGHHDPLVTDDCGSPEVGARVVCRVRFLFQLHLALQEWLAQHLQENIPALVLAARHEFAVVGGTPELHQPVDVAVAQVLLKVGDHVRSQ